MTVKGLAARRNHEHLTKACITVRDELVRFGQKVLPMNFRHLVERYVREETTEIDMDRGHVMKPEHSKFAYDWFKENGGAALVDIDPGRCYLRFPKGGIDEQAEAAEAQAS